MASATAILEKPLHTIEHLLTPRAPIAESLIGRPFELNAIVEFVADLGEPGSSRDRARILSGEPGVGKTALLEAAIEAAAIADVRVLHVVGVEFEADVFFSGLAHVLRPLSSELTKLSASSQSVLGAVNEVRAAAPESIVLCSATLELLLACGADRPVLLVVDDLQWIDEPSAITLAFVARRLRGSRVGFLGALRAGTACVFADAGVPVQHVRPLDDVAASSLLGTRFPMLAGRVHQRLLAEAQGNPLALLELPTTLSDPQRNAELALPAVLPVNRRLAGVFASRISRLSTNTRGLLLLAALEGSGALRVLQAAAGGAQRLSALDAAEQARLVSIDEGSHRLTFRHPLIRSTVVEMASVSERAWAHRRLAEVLTDQPERQAWHLSESAAAPDEELAALLETAARSSLDRGDVNGALSALRGSARVSPGRSTRGRRLAEAAYLSAEVTGELKLASGLLSGARQARPDAPESLAEAVASSYLLLNAECEVDAAYAVLVAAIARHGERFDPQDEVLVNALQSLIMLCWVSGRAERWETLNEAMSRFTPEPPALLRWCAATVGDPVRQAQHVLDELPPAAARSDAELDPVAIARLGIACVYVDQLSYCRRALSRVVDDGRHGGAIALAMKAIVSRCVDDWQNGDWEGARQLAVDGGRLAETHGFQVYSFILSGYIEALVSAGGGESAGALALADDMGDWGEAKGVGLAVVCAHHVRALVALSHEEFEVAYHELEAISPAGSLDRYEPHALWVLFDLVEAAVNTGRRVEASAHVDAINEAGVARISPRLTMVAMGVSALVAADDQATALFQGALAVVGADQWPFEMARIQLAYAQHLRRLRLVADARAAFVGTLEIFERLGAKPWARRASEGLRASGQAASHAVCAAAVNLTPQELEIATLAAEGLANKEIGKRLFLSHRTVGAYLYQLFPKLGITSRAALRDALSSVSVT